MGAAGTGAAVVVAVVGRPQSARRRGWCWPRPETALVPVAFADASFGDVVEATEVHRWYYGSFAWYEEWRHIDTLMAGPWALRLPVLMTVGVGLLVAWGRTAAPPTARSAR
ncbi:hypothetical protein EIL87_01935 [Saccharopolyspora rhizosphaerae]|uniref:Uncharacterized protein n=1 Tax=Saccharopolyspora rhizosphaerae TaxID=2492662 RepID=A0A3R8R882_9PSEU|nr:hypothetical protein [Saccharopolyspora rhizosphaerae]RRO20651.1 hypothetical protein EIL87_01935 [Saccharopolyspora rhizosphaerae]